MVPTYLSIDCDFWIDPKQASREITALVEEALARSIPLRAVMNHQQLLPYVNASGARRLVNLDEHSDVVDKNVDFFDCGTWVSYVKWRHLGEYLWVGPHGRAHDCGEPHIFLQDFYYTKPEPETSDWKKLGHLLVHGAQTDLLDSCVEVGLCLSPSWVRPEIERIFYQLVKAHGLPYKKGRRDEEPGYSGKRRFRRPPAPWRFAP